MMELTPLDVRKKRDDFKRAVRGYDPVQVDAFLEMCADRLDELVQRDKRHQAELDAMRERLTAFEDRERALNEALVSAQELREEARAQAERSAELKIREAEQEAAAIRQRAEAATEASRRALQDLTVRRAGFLRSLRWSIERFLGEIDEEERRVVSKEGVVSEEEDARPPAAGPVAEPESDDEGGDAERDTDAGAEDDVPERSGAGA